MNAYIFKGTEKKYWKKIERQRRRKEGKMKKSVDWEERGIAEDDRKR